MSANGNGDVSYGRSPTIYGWGWQSMHAVRSGNGYMVEVAIDACGWRWS